MMDIALDRARLGERWVLRCRLADGSATDVVGWLVSMASESVSLEVEGGDSVTVDRRRSSSPDAPRVPGAGPSRAARRRRTSSGPPSRVGSL